MKYSNSLSSLSLKNEGSFDILPFPEGLRRNPSELRGIGNRKPERQTSVKFF